MRNARHHKLLQVNEAVARGTCDALNYEWMMIEDGNKNTSSLNVTLAIEIVGFNKYA